MGRRFVLLDRDGTLNVERNYLADADQLELLPGVVAGLTRLQELGCGLVVITNQSGVGRGLIAPTQLAGIHRRLHRMLSAVGIVLDGIYVCPHHPETPCHCRKPLTGMATQAARDFGFSLNQSFLIGDKPSDIELGRRVGATTLLVRTGYGAESERDWQRDSGTEAYGAPDCVVDDLLAAAEAIAVRLKATGESRRRNVA
ncbi:MAG: HAD family hydrolase [Planctomycetota bacterium]|nr:HAD family hydrolase [Planctomycetota bacterium]